MKKTILSMVVAISLFATNVSANECPSKTDRIVFGIVGILQGVVIGGPVGAFWGLGTAIYADNYESPESCNEKPQDENSAVQLATQNEKSNEQISKEETSIDKRLNEISQNSLNKADTNGFIAIPTVVNFAFDSYKIEAIPQKLKELNNGIIEKIKIEGHTDPKGTDEYNYALGLKRANAVKKVLVSQGIEAEKMSTISYGESTPISADDAKNRRVDLLVKPVK